MAKTRMRLSLMPLFLLVFLITAGSKVFPQNLYIADSGTGETQVAERYAVWAKEMAEEGRWHEVLLAMERAADYREISSDLSYLLALARHRQGHANVLVIEALNVALEVNRWTLYDPEEARFLFVEMFLAIKAWPNALAELAAVSSGPREAELRLKALAAYSPLEFRNFMAETLDRYPRETAPVRVFFDFITDLRARDIMPLDEDLQLLELILRRLPALLLNDAELAWMAAPYIHNLDEARRMLLAYRAVNYAVPNSLPISLYLGVIDEDTAMEELFSSNILDIRLLGEVWDLLRHDNARAIFRQHLASFSGFILRDDNRDMIPESYSAYSNGILLYSSFNYMQDGIEELMVYFDAGVPEKCLVLLPYDASSEAAAGREESEIIWERFPSVLEAHISGVKFTPRPFDFFYQPIVFEELWGSGLFFINLNPSSPPLTRTTIVSYSLLVERQSLEFAGGIEVIELNQSIPVRAREYVGELMVSETEFLRGRPQLQRVDLNMNGTMDTVRLFGSNYPEMELHELWDYPRNFDYSLSEWDDNIIRN